VITHTATFQIVSEGMVHRIVLKSENIWLSHTLNIIWKPKKYLFSKRKRAITHER